ncbi:methyltransferase domain-containing protein [Ignatzschineria indica]|uniref:methyltransferase domain-containing protein n=1 Tax=Ignatzschineria indica TaxID=472583 RepID=UPI002576F2C5|nr:methyltransferase domain-containing protein [Ignatzschineria indica]MDM1544471.1 methyltransferase domain-containing protein [Ignatzschineria indica]
MCSLIDRVAKPEVQKKFGTYAAQYDSVAVVQREIADRLMTRYLLPALLPLSDKKSGKSGNREDKVRESSHPIKILDAGAGTGYLGRALRAALVTAPIVNSNSIANSIEGAIDTDQSSITDDPSSTKMLLKHQIELTAFDLAPEMLSMTKAQGGYQIFVEGDIEQIGKTFSAASFDFTMSSLAVQWCHSLRQALIGLQGVTQQRLFVTTLLDGTLQELENAFKAVDDQQHILPFLSLEEASHIVTQLGGELVHYEKVMCFPTLKALFKSLRSIGASALPARRKGLIGRNDFLKIDQYFQQLGAYQLTYHVAEIVLPGNSVR